jgi:hypothetical protein
VSAYGWGNEYCTIKDLVSYSGKVYIDCFTPSGDPINTTYVSAYLVGSNLN